MTEGEMQRAGQGLLGAPGSAGRAGARLPGAGPPLPCLSGRASRAAGVEVRSSGLGQALAGARRQLRHSRPTSAARQARTRPASARRTRLPLV